MDRLKRSIKRKLSAIICTRCGLAGHNDRDQRCPQWGEKEIQTFPPLTVQCYVELTNLLNGFKDQICLTDDDVQWRERICRMIENSIRPLYPSAQLVLFGSSANGFGSIHSDLDISMKLTGATGHKAQASIVRSLMKQLKRHSSREKWSQGDIKCIPWAKVPIVKMKLSHRWNSMECDISVGNYMALHNTEMLSAYARIDERVQTLGVALKQFAKSNGMCDASTGSLSSYAYILLLLHYLQQVKPPVIPVLQQVGVPGVKIVDGCNCWFYRFDSLRQLSSVWPHVRRNQSSVGELWVSFFKYYAGEFDWSRRVVTVRRLEPLSKFEKSWRHKSACIEDPFNLSRNLAGHLSDAMWAYIQEVLSNGHNRFCDPAFYRTPITCERVFDNCGDIEDLPLKSVKRVIRDPANYPELPAATTGKRRHQATIHQDNTVIFIDDTDEEDDEKFVAKKQCLVSYGSKDTQRHVQYSSPPSKHSSSSNPVPINATSPLRSTIISSPEYHKAPLLHKQEQKPPPQQQQQVLRSYSVHGKPLLAYPVHASQPLYGNDSTLRPRFNQSNSPHLLESTPWSAYNNTISSATSRASSDVSFCSETVTRHDHSYKTTEQLHRQAPWLRGLHPDHNYTVPETSSRRQDDQYSRRYSLDICPTSSTAYQQTSSHVSNPQAMLDHGSRDHDRSSGATRNSYSTTSNSRSGSKNWSAPSDSPSVTDHWRHPTHHDNAGDKAGDKMSDLFPLLYANSVLSSYSSSHQDKSHSDYHYGSSHYGR